MDGVGEWATTAILECLSLSTRPPPIADPEPTEGATVEIDDFDPPHGTDEC